MNRKKQKSFMRKNTFLRSLLLLVCLSASAVGCEQWHAPVESRYSEQRLREIEAVRFAQQSQAEPKTLETASKELTDQPRKRDEPAELLSLTLPEVRASALRQNLGLQVALVDPLIAAEQLAGEDGKFEPSFDAFVTHRRQELDADGFRATNGSFGITMPTVTGGEASIQTPWAALAPDQDDESYDSALAFSISQPLMRNAGVRVNTASIRIAEYGTRLTSAQTRLRVINTLADADRAYWALFAARRRLDVAWQQYRLTLNLVDRAKKRVEAKASPPIEITRARSGIASRLEEIIRAETQVRIRQRALIVAMNRDEGVIDDTGTIQTVSEPDPRGLELNRDALVARALDQRAEIIGLEIQLAIDDERIEVNKNRTLPDVRVNGSYGLRGLGSSFDESLRQWPDDTWSLGLSASVPLDGSRAAQSQYHRSLLERFRRSRSIQERRLLIQQQVYDELDRLNQSWERIVAAHYGVLIAAMTYEAEEKQLEIGARTSIEVLEAATRLASQQLREIQALADYEIAKVDLAVATGVLIGEGNIVW